MYVNAFQVNEVSAHVIDPASPAPFRIGASLLNSAVQSTKLTCPFVVYDGPRKLSTNSYSLTLLVISVPFFSFLFFYYYFFFFFLKPKENLRLFELMSIIYFPLRHFFIICSSSTF
jgi:hypothetical protein